MKLDEKIQTLQEIVTASGKSWDFYTEEKDRERLWKAYEQADPVAWTIRYMKKFADYKKIMRRINAAVSVGQGKGIKDDVILEVVNIYARHLFKVIKLTPVQIAQLKCAGLVQ